MKSKETTDRDLQSGTEEYLAQASRRTFQNQSLTRQSSNNDREFSTNHAMFAARLCG